VPTVRAGVQLDVDVQFVRQVDDLAGARDGLGDGTVGEPGKPLGRHGVGLLPFV
jgi:hypothetical protein